MKRLFFCAILSCLLTIPLLVFAAATEAQGPLIGEIRYYAGTSIPSGWFLADGSCISSTQYSELYAVIALYYDDGVTCDTGYVQLPSLIGRFPMGSNSTVGIEGGESEHTLTVAEMPQHNHLIYLASSNILASGGSYKYPGQDAVVATNHTQYSGGGQAHNNMPPYLWLKPIIAYTTTTNITPTPTITPTATPTPTSTPVITGSVPYVSAYTQTLTSGNELVVPVYVTFGNIFVVGTGALILVSFLLSMLVRVTK